MVNVIAVKRGEIDSRAANIKWKTNFSIFIFYHYYHYTTSSKIDYANTYFLNREYH